MHYRKTGKSKSIATENNYQLYSGYEPTGVEKNHESEGPYRTVEPRFNRSY